MPRFRGLMGSRSRREQPSFFFNCSALLCDCRLSLSSANSQVTVFCLKIDPYVIGEDGKAACGLNSDSDGAEACILSFDGIERRGRGRREARFGVRFDCRKMDRRYELRGGGYHLRRATRAGVSHI